MAAITFSLGLPNGFVWELASRQDPVAAYEAMTEVARTAEASGYETIWASDHLMTVPPSQSMVFECWTSVAALLRDTETLRVGQLVTCNNYHNPALSAKMASTVDVLGHGRFTFGIGAGWYEPDYQSYGFEFLAAPERLKQLEEAVQIITAMWTEEAPSFQGKYYQINNAINQPKGVQLPHIPMMIAGGGEKVTLKLVGRYGDLCNVVGDPAEVARKFAILKGYAEAAGRDPAGIRRTVLMLASIGDTDAEAAAQVPQWAPAVFPGDISSYGLIGTVETIRERIEAYHDAGVQEFIVSFPNTYDLDVIRQFAQEFIK